MGLGKLFTKPLSGYPGGYKKLRRGYPQTNIIFENSDRATLIQNRDHVMTCSMTRPSSILKGA